MMTRAQAIDLLIKELRGPGKMEQQRSAAERLLEVLDPALRFDTEVGGMSAACRGVGRVSDEE